MPDRFGSTSFGTQILGRSLPQRLDMGLLLRILSVHPGRQVYRWWKGFENPAMGRVTKETPQEGRIIRFEQTPEDASYQGIFDVHRTSKTFRDAFGAMDESSTTLVFIPGVTPLAVGDHVMPWGKIGDGSDVTHKIQSQTLVRGGDKVAGSGRISITGTNLTCTVAHGLGVSDVVHTLGQSFLVLSAPTTTTATLATAPASTITSVTWELGRDYLTDIYPKSIESLLIPSGLTYVQASPLNLCRVRSSWSNTIGGDVDPGTGNERCWIEWLDPDRVGVGDQYSLRVKIMPLYRVSENGIQLPGWDYGGIYEHLDQRVTDPSESAPMMATLTLVTR